MPPNGMVSNVPGLESKQAASDGTCTWTWEIAADTATGTATLTIVSNGDMKDITFIIQ